MASTLSSNSTLAQVEAEYDNTADYFAVEDVSLAKRHATAIGILIRRLPSNVIKGSSALTQRVDLLRDELTAVRQWLKSRDPSLRAGPSVTVANFNRARG